MRTDFVVYGVLIALILTLQACSNGPKKPTLSDLKSRYWKGTYYYSVKESPTSIKCSISPEYVSASDVPVSYQGEDARSIFTSDEDQEKITALQRQCLEKSRETYLNP